MPHKDSPGFVAIVAIVAVVAVVAIVGVHRGWSRTYSVLS